MIRIIVASLIVFVDGIHYRIDTGSDAATSPFSVGGIHAGRQFYWGRTCLKTQLPKVVYIGVGHSGSTLLVNMMNEHPDLSFGTMGEHNTLWKYQGDKTNFLNTYGQQFLMSCDKKVAFDSTPRLLFCGLTDDEEMKTKAIGLKYGLGVGAVRALRDLLGPETQFISMFRDPVPWAMSNGVPAAEITNATDFQLGVEAAQSLHNHDNPADELVHQTLLSGRFARRGCYANALEAWLAVFPRRNFLFLSSDAFFRDQQATMDHVSDFVGVPRFALQGNPSRSSGRRRNARKPSWAAYQRFHEHPRSLDCKQRLENLTGVNFQWGTLEDFTRQELD